jgi:galactokinase
MAVDTSRLRRVFAEVFGRDPAVVAEAPGRVNLIGEHTDYNEGFVLPVAIDRTVAVASAPRDDHRLRVYSLDFGECDEFEASPQRLAEGGWRNYVRGIAAEIHGMREGIGADLAIAGDVPVGAGLSSSAAIEVAAAGAIAAAHDLELGPRETALLAQRAENDFVGVQCGIMDQFASALSRSGHALLIDCRSLVAEAVALPTDLVIVVVNSGVARDLADTPYNKRRQECAEAADILDVDALRDIDEARLPDIESELGEPLGRRVRHVVTENARVHAAVHALRRGDTAELARLLYRSHESLRDDFEASAPELDRLVEIARHVDGVLGARMTGAGWGGCVVALARPDAVPALEQEIATRYRAPDGTPADVWVCRSSDGLRVKHV